MGLTVVWFKRDLRITDHAPLWQAAREGQVLPLYVLEPDYWQQPDTSLRHWEFLRESLIDLDAGLTALGQPLILQVGRLPDVLERLYQQFGPFRLYSHQETGNGWTYARDLELRTWCVQRGIYWREFQSGGVVRRLRDRDQWAEAWEQVHIEPPLPTPASLPWVSRSSLDPSSLPMALGWDRTPCPYRQTGGRRQALRELDSFLGLRGMHYTRDLSSPTRAFTGGSRLSPYLALGSVSAREVIARTRDTLESREQAGERVWVRSLQAFLARLLWRDHFTQKLEDEPELEWRCLHRDYAGLRAEGGQPEWLAAWRAGQTGFPLVDACMRSLQQIGWINFRMRAMLVAFASYQLWQHWREPALHLARYFTDYEPGIHYPQIQMQSGTTGINVWRIYNPVLQSRQQDPEGVFIRTECPELARVPSEYLHTPWLMPIRVQRESGCRIGRDYPLPIVDHEIAARQARQRLKRYVELHVTAAETRRVMHRHASRRFLQSRPRLARDQEGDEQSLLQLDLFAQ